MSSDVTRCAHQGCTCRVAEAGQFCSPSCETAGGHMGDACACGHPGCANSTSNASSEGRPASTINQP